jgi:hypothetical protein
MYDLLCKINDGMKENWQWKPCIMSALGFDFFERADRCRKYGEAENKRCGDCIGSSAITSILNTASWKQSRMPDCAVRIAAQRFRRKR